uniref:Uncharacterized protein n=1 Tax=Clastoptera arizonana TaxID=38151 RepID=A0A1B6DWP6_9HEMI
MNSNSGAVSIGRVTSVQSGICRGSFLYEQSAGGDCTFDSDQTDTSSWGIEVYELFVVRPDHMRGRLRGEGHQAGEVDGAAKVDEHFRASYDLCDGFNNCKMNRVPYGRRGADLTLVHSRVLPLRITYPEGPVLSVRGVDGLKPLVTGVRVTPHCQEVDVTMSDPRDRPVPEVLYPAIQVSSLAYQSR